MIPKKQGKGQYIIYGIAAFFVLILMLHIGNYMFPAKINNIQNTQTSLTDKKGNQIQTTIDSTKVEQEMNLNFIEALPKAIKDMENPLTFFKVFPVSAKTIFIVFVILILEGLGFMYMKARAEAMKNDLPNTSDGSAKWNDNQKKYDFDMTIPYTKEMEKEDAPDMNILLADGVKLSSDRFRKIPAKGSQIDRNWNVLVVGGPGTGKSFGVIKPNLMQCNTSAIITDPSGEILRCCGKYLRQKGAIIKQFSTSDMIRSNCYNPFDYVYDENGDIDETKVATMVTLFLKNATNNKKGGGGDPFWEKSSKALLSAICYYLIEGEKLKEIKKNDVNFNSVLKLVQAGKLDEDSSSSQSKLDLLMEQRKHECDKQNIPCKAYDNFATFKLAPAKTGNSILISCAVDLQLFGDQKVIDLTRTDEDPYNNVNLSEIGEVQTYLFINIPQANPTYNFLVSMLYSQMFESLYTKGEKILPKKYHIYDKYGRPIATMFDSKEKAEKALEKLKEAEIKKVITKHGVDYYRICYGNEIITERASEEGALEAIRLTNEAYVKNTNEKSPWHIRCLMDEFANIGEVPEFSEKLATMRKYEISCTIVLQSLAQIKAKYDKLYEAIIGGCDTTIFLGSNELETDKYISELLGKTTIRTRSTSRSSGGKGSFSQSYQSKARNLLDPNEVASIDNKWCIVKVRGKDPFYVKKYSFLMHPKFKYSGNASIENELSDNELKQLFCSTPLDRMVKKDNIKENERKLGKADASVIANGYSEYVQPTSFDDLKTLVNMKDSEDFKENVLMKHISLKNMKTQKQNSTMSKKQRLLKASAVSVLYDEISGADGGFYFGV